MKFIDWFQQYNKAWVGIIMMTLYLVNKHYGWDIPLDEDTSIAILSMLISAVTYAVPNRQPMSGEDLTSDKVK